MINIRSTTIGIDTSQASGEVLKKDIKKFIDLSDKLFMESDISVRTHRLTTTPIDPVNSLNDAAVQSVARWITDLGDEVGVRWFCLPFDFKEDDFKLENVNVLTNILKKFPQAFLNVMIAGQEQINKNSIISASKLIKNVSSISQNGFDNFRLGISANCKPHTPFFPFSFHDGEKGFSLALEILENFIHIAISNSNESLDIKRKLLIEGLKRDLVKVQDLAMALEKKTGFKYLGLDSSLAPFPDGRTSIGRLLESLGIEFLGSNGTLFMTSFLTNIIKSAIKETNVKSVGFNGVMYSVLEDDSLAYAAKSKNISLDSLALYSSVCGCGLDMIPLPGDIFEEEISSLILDVSSLSIALDKPLGIRLLPIPGKRVNEMTEFNFDFLIDTRVFEIKNQSISLESLSPLLTNLKKV